MQGTIVKSAEASLTMVKQEAMLNVDHRFSAGIDDKAFITISTTSIKSPPRRPSQRRRRR